MATLISYLYISTLTTYVDHLLSRHYNYSSRYVCNPCMPPLGSYHVHLAPYMPPLGSYHVHLTPYMPPLGSYQSNIGNPCLVYSATWFILDLPSSGQTVFRRNLALKPIVGMIRYTERGGVNQYYITLYFYLDYVVSHSLMDSISNDTVSTQ